MSDDVFKTAPRFAWRGIELPLVSRRATFSHQEITHAIQYANGEIIEITVRNNWRFDYTIPFRDGIIKGPYGKLYTDRLKPFLDSFLDSSPGELVDPVLSPRLGSFSARPLSFIDSTDVQRRDGDDIEVSFVENKTSDELETTDDTSQSAAGMISAGRVLDQQLAVLDWGAASPEQISSEEQTWTQSDPPEPSVNPIDAVAGIFRQGERATQRTKSVFADTARRLDALEDAVNDSSSAVDRWYIVANARSLRLNVLRADSNEREKRKPRRITHLPSDMTPTAAAALVKLSLSEFLTLNPALSTETMLDQGQIVLHYK